MKAIYEEKGNITWDSNENDGIGFFVFFQREIHYQLYELAIARRSSKQLSENVLSWNFDEIYLSKTLNNRILHFARNVFEMFQFINFTCVWVEFATYFFRKWFVCTKRASHVHFLIYLILISSKHLRILRPLVQYG